MSQAGGISTHGQHDNGMSRRNILLGSTILAAVSATGSAAQAQPAPPPRPATAPGRKPNILVIFGDDIGLWNVSAYNRGRRTSTASPGKARSSPTITRSNPARPGAPRSSPASPASAPGF